jgi:ElaB/YqjD/DUF883 family membrane-anchored ribosome-binding protein
MNKYNHPSRHETTSLVEDAGALLSATADVAGEKVGEARKRLAVALEGTKEMAINIRNKAVAGAKATDKIVHEHPYKSIAVMLGVGALIGVILARRNTSKEV